MILVNQLYDGAEDKYVRAYVTSEDGTSLSGSPFALTHQLQGKYVYFDFSNFTYPEGAEQVHATYIVYTDAAYTQESKKHSRSLDVFHLDPSESSTISIEDIDNKLDQIINVLSSTFPGAEITGIVERDEELIGMVTQDEVIGLIHSDEILGHVLEEEIVGIVADNEITGLMEGTEQCQ